MVEIKIDTSKDSKEDIKKVIDFLKKFTEESVEVEVPEGVFSIFDEPQVDKDDNGDDEKIEDKEDDLDDDIDIKPMFY